MKQVQNEDYPSEKIRLSVSPSPKETSSPAPLPSLLTRGLSFTFPLKLYDTLSVLINWTAFSINLQQSDPVGLHSLSLSLSFCLSVSLSLTHTHTHTLSLWLFLHSLPLSLPWCHRKLPFAALLPPSLLSCCLSQSLPHHGTTSWQQLDAQTYHWENSSRQSAIVCHQTPIKSNCWHYYGAEKLNNNGFPREISRVCCLSEPICSVFTRRLRRVILTFPWNGKQLITSPGICGIMWGSHCCAVRATTRANPSHVFVLHQRCSVSDESFSAFCPGRGVSWYIMLLYLGADWCFHTCHQQLINNVWHYGSLTTQAITCQRDWNWSAPIVSFAFSSGMHSVNKEFSVNLVNLQKKNPFFFGIYIRPTSWCVVTQTHPSRSLYLLLLYRCYNRAHCLYPRHLPSVTLPSQQRASAPFSCVFLKSQSSVKH